MPNMPEFSIACYVLTPQGLALAQSLAAQLPLVIFAAKRLHGALPEWMQKAASAAPSCSPSALSAPSPELLAGKTHPPVLFSAHPSAIAAASSAALPATPFSDNEESPRTDFHTFSSLPACVAEQFAHFRAHLFLTATGIAVRCIAPHLAHKSSDPAVLVMEQRGRFVIPLLSGHWGGGNALAERMAALCGGQAVLTTATDTANLPAIDVLAQARDCRIVDWTEVKHISAAILRGEAVPLCDPQHIFSEEDAPPQYFPRCAAVPHSGPAVLADWMTHPPRPELLRLAPRRLTLGIGCRRGVAADDICEAVRASCRAADIELAAVCQLASIEAKRDEQGLLEAAKRLGLPLRWFSAAALAAVDVPHPSAKASAVFAAPALGVCEGAALLAAGAGGRLILPKQKYHACVTVACAAAGGAHFWDTTERPPRH